MSAGSSAQPETVRTSVATSISAVVSTPTTASANRKAYVADLARRVLVLRGLDDWIVKWDSAKRRAGCCNHTKKTLSFSAILVPLYSEDVLRDVVLHEVAHAICGPQAGHGNTWKAEAARLGATPKAMLPGWLPEPPAKWIGRCPSCGGEKRLHAMPRRVVSCGVCSRDFKMELIFKWEHLGRRVEPGGNYAKELARIRRRYMLREPQG